MWKTRSRMHIMVPRMLPSAHIIYNSVSTHRLVWKMACVPTACRVCCEFYFHRFKLPLALLARIIRTPGLFPTVATNRTANASPAILRSWVKTWSCRARHEEQLLSLSVQLLWFKNHESVICFIDLSKFSIPSRMDTHHLKHFTLFLFRQQLDCTQAMPSLGMAVTWFCVQVG